jgi:hypothetical protein
MSEQTPEEGPMAVAHRITHVIAFTTSFPSVALPSN